MGNSWSRPEVIEWKKAAADFQKIMYLLFGNRIWDDFEPNEHHLLAMKVAYALFGPPENINDDQDPMIASYTNQQQYEAKRITGVIITQWLKSGQALLRVKPIFVHIKAEKNQYTLPVFRLFTGIKDNVIFSQYVDHTGRYYDSWDHYLKTNSLPECIICYPKYGYYSYFENDNYGYDMNKFPALSYCKSPASNFVRKCTDVFDGIGTVGGLGASGILIVSMFTPVGQLMMATAAVTAVGSAIYGAARSVDHLIDKGTHGESLTDLDALTCWLGIVGGAFRIATPMVNGIISSAAKTGQLFNQTTRIAVTTMSISNLCLDSVSVALGTTNLIKKSINGQLTTLDLLQFSISVFFFGHTFISPITAGQVIKASQIQYLDHLRDSIENPNNRSTFEEFLTKNQNNHGLINGNANVICAIRYINDPNEFFSTLNETGSKVSVKNDGIMNLNNQIDIHSSTINEMSLGRQKLLLEVTAKFDRKEITLEQFSNDIKTFRKEERFTFTEQQKIAISLIEKFFGNDDISTLKINGRKLFNQMSPYDADRILKILNNYGLLNLNPKQKIMDNLKSVAAVAQLYSIKIGVKNQSQFCSLLELIKMEINQKKTSADKSSLLQNLQDPNSNETISFLKNLESDLIKARKIRKGADYKFTDNLSAVYHFRKHGFEFGNFENQMKVYLSDATCDLFSKKKYLYYKGLTQDGKFCRKMYANRSKMQVGFLIESRDGKQRVASTYSDPLFFKTTDEEWESTLKVAEKRLQNSDFIPTPVGFFDLSYFTGNSPYSKSKEPILRELFRAMACFYV